MLSVKTNLLAMNADRQLGINTKKNTRITEKLSSGYKINRAADDAAGLAISEKMRRQIRGLTQGAANIKDGIGYVQTAEGALNEVHDMLQRINELSVKAANGTWTEEDRGYIDSEVQALKKEIDRIFDTTSFNEQNIWEVEKNREVVGQRPEKVFKFNRSQSSLDITDENCGVIANKSGYNMKADENGITVSWTGYNKKSYETDIITWEKLEQNNYSFEISDYFKAEDTDLISKKTGEKLFKHTVSMSVNSAVKSDKLKDDVRNEIIKAINGPYNNGTTISQGASSPITARLEDTGGNAAPKQWKNTSTNASFSVSLDYATAYKSYINSAKGYDFDTAKDVFLEPTISGNTNLQCPSADNEKWIFSFNMEGIGKVTAESRSITYSASDTTGKEGVWWDWYYPKNEPRRRAGNSYNGGGTLGDVKKALSPSSGNGLLNKSTYGLENASGSITLYFDLKSGNDTIGSMSTTIPVKCGKNAETTQAVLDRIDSVFNSNTILDIYTSDSNVKSTVSISRTETAWTGSVDVDVYGDNFLYGGVKSFFVQAGAEAGQHISIEYDALNIILIGLENTNTLTEEAAGNAINEVKTAMEIVSKQRSEFGAYQNRLEHAYNINNNTVENTQAAESLIRDTDIADAMMEYSVNNILMQAGVSMLTQANQLPNSIIELLNA